MFLLKSCFMYFIIYYRWKTIFTKQFSYSMSSLFVFTKILVFTKIQVKLPKVRNNFLLQINFQIVQSVQIFSACGVVFLISCFHFFFLQRAVSYFIGEIFFGRPKSVTWRCSVQKVSCVSCNIYQEAPVLESFLSIKLRDRDL